VGRPEAAARTAHLIAAAARVAVHAGTVHGGDHPLNVRHSDLGTFTGGPALLVEAVETTGAEVTTDRITPPPRFVTANKKTPACGGTRPSVSIARNAAAWSDNVNRPRVPGLPDAGRRVDSQEATFRSESEGSLSRSRDWLKPIPPAPAVKREDQEDPDTVEIWR
jgi:hypothetical protein